MRGTVEPFFTLSRAGSAPRSQKKLTEGGALSVVVGGLAWRLVRAEPCGDREPVLSYSDWCSGTWVGIEQDSWLIPGSPRRAAEGPASSGQVLRSYATMVG